MRQGGAKTQEKKEKKLCLANKLEEGWPKEGGFFNYCNRRKRKNASDCKKLRGGKCFSFFKTSFMRKSFKDHLFSLSLSLSSLPDSLQLSLSHSLTLSLIWEKFLRIGRTKSKAESWWKRGRGSVGGARGAWQSLRACTWVGRSKATVRQSTWKAFTDQTKKIITRLTPLRRSHTRHRQTSNSDWSNIVRTLQVTFLNYSIVGQLEYQAVILIKACASGSVLCSMSTRGHH